MIKKTVHTFKSGEKTQVRVVEGYRVFQNGKSQIKQRTIKNFGYLEEQLDKVAFLKKVEEYDKSFRENKTIDISYQTNIKWHQDPSNKLYNYGHVYLEAIYEKLKLSEYIKKIPFKGDYDLNEIFKFLVFQRVLSPDSRRATMQSSKSFYNKVHDFSLADVYRALDKYCLYMMDMQKHINDVIKEIIGRDNELVFYDVTNYYFEIDYPDEDNGLRKRGVSKEHRLEPIVQLGLFMDENAIPICMSLFPGNTSDSITLQPAMEQIKKDYNLKRLIVVGDKGINSTSNINYIVNNGDGYIVSQILRGPKGKRYHKYIENDEGYTYSSSRTEKYILFEEEYEGLDNNGKKITRKRKVAIYWSKKEADMIKKKRDEKILRAKKALKNNVYLSDHSKMEYLKEISIISETGEVCDKKIYELNNTKIETEEKFDGYFCIITSELNYDYQTIRKNFGCGWKIEETFKITKFNLSARPVYVSVESHIKAHFLICFVALTIIRILQYKLKDDNISAERIQKALNACKCQIPKKGIIHIPNCEVVLKYKKRLNKNNELVETLKLSEDNDLIEDIGKILKVFNVDYFFSYSKQEKFDKYLNSIKL